MNLTATNLTTSAAVKATAATLPTSNSINACHGLEARIATFRSLLDGLVSLAAHDGARIVAYDDPELAIFRSLPADSQSAVISAVAAYVQAAETTQKQGFSIRDSKALTWRMLKHLGFTPLSNAFEFFDSSDYLEVYNDQHQLVFASLNFFELTSYTLEELYCRPWMELYERDEEVTARLYDAACRLLSGETHGNVFLNMKPAKITETGGRRQSGMMHTKLLSPVFTQGQPAGFISQLVLDQVL